VYGEGLEGGVTQQVRRLAGKSAIVAGSSRGIGFAVARAMARQGAAVIVNGRDPMAAKDAANRLADEGAQVVAVPGDMSIEGVAESLVATCKAEFGGVDIAVNCAGLSVHSDKPILTASLTDFRDKLDAHLVTAFQLARAVAPTMAAQRSGSIVLSSSLGFRGTYAGTGDPAANGGVVSLSFALAQELVEHGVRVNTVLPTAQTDGSAGQEYRAWIDGLYQRGIVDDVTREGALNPAPPEYAAQVYAFLASDLAKDITKGLFVASGNFVGRYPLSAPMLVAYRDFEQTEPYTLEELATMVRPDWDVP
jgi:NAD(P)-dependent dehydrogenase (short-subunit alcohol dehydrogenase family)